MIVEMLRIGAENAITGKELSQALNCDLRVITAAVERERRQGQPICASCQGSNPGYYLPESAEQLERYCRSLNHRAAQLKQTQQALLTVLQKYATKKNTEGGK